MEWIVIVVVLYLISVYLFSSSKHEEKDSTERTETFDIAYYDKLYTPSFSRKAPIVLGDMDFTLPTKKAGNQFMSAQDKAAYLQSTEWQNLRQLVFSRDNHQCQLCSSPNALNCHHISYENLGSESLDQLVTLCQDCHSALHLRLGYDRITRYNIKD